MTVDKLSSTVTIISKEEQVYAISYKNSADNKRKPSLSSIRSAVDFETAIKETGYGKFNCLLLLLAFPASCSSTYDTTSLSFVLPTASCDLKLDAYDRGCLNGTIYAGMIVSAFFWGYVSDRFGRQRVLVFGYLGDVIFGIAASLSPTFWSILIFKFLSGMMISGPFSIFLSYLSELFHSKHRDSVVMMVGFFQAVGGVIQPFLAWAIIPLSIRWTLFNGLIIINSWKLFLLVCSLPSLIAGLGILFCHESPKFLLAMGRRDEALRVFRSIYSTNTGKPEDTYSVKKLKLEGTGPACRMKFWQQMTGLFRPPHIYKALFTFSIQFGGLATLNTIRLWLPQLFFFIKESKEEPMNICEVLAGNHTAIRVDDCDSFKVDTSVYSNMVYVNFLTGISFAISIAVIRHIGKRNLFVTLFLLQSAVISMLGWVHPSLTTILAAIFVALSYTSSIGLLGFVVQIFPTSLRTMAVSLTMMFGRIGVVIGNGVLPFALHFSCPGTFIGVSFITLFCAFMLIILAASASKQAS